MLNEIVSAWNGLHCLVQLVLGVVVFTWFPVGVAAGSMLFAMDIRRFPVQTLEHYYYYVLGFWCMVLAGWLAFLLNCVLLSITPNRRELFSGVLIPGKNARLEAERLHSLIRMCGLKEPLSLKLRKLACP